jgi:hypothetical protein
MRIPIGESEMGVWYPIGDAMYFVSKSTTHYINNPGNYNKCGRESTFAAFKQEFPYEINGQGCYRTKKKPK